MLELERGVKVVQVSKVKSNFLRQEHEVEEAEWKDPSCAVAEVSGLHPGGSGSAGLWLSLLC